MIPFATTLLAENVYILKKNSLLSSAAFVYYVWTLPFSDASVLACLPHALLPSSSWALVAFCLSFVYFSYMTKSTDFVLLLATSLPISFFLLFYLFPFSIFAFSTARSYPTFRCLHVAYLKSTEIYVQNLRVNPPGPHVCATN